MKNIIIIYVRKITLQTVKIFIFVQLLPRELSFFFSTRFLALVNLRICIPQTSGEGSVDG